MPKQKSSSKPDSTEKNAELSRWRGSKTLLFSVGSSNHADDGAGPELLRLLRGRTSAMLLDGGGAPENMVHKAVNAGPERILLVDASDFGQNPGYFRIFSPHECGGQSFSPHGLTLSMLSKFLRLSLPDCEIALLGIQPASLSPEREGLSREVADSVRVLADLLAEK